MKVHLISPEKIDFTTLEKVLAGDIQLQLSDASKKLIVDCRNYLDAKMAKSKLPIYGINTGFGALCNTQISDKDLERLQHNLVISHACGMGEEVPQEIVKLMLFLKIHALSLGKSAVQLQTVERLIWFFNNDVLPVVYQQGSLGASGDLAPLAHLSLPLIGLGEVYHKGVRKSTEQLYNEEKLDAIRLKSKEGLALLNGTQFMSAYGSWCILQAKKISSLSDKIAAVSLDAFDGRIEPFNENIHLIRPHKGQLETASFIKNFLAGSEIVKREKAHVQDPYCFRCVPQVHGASKDAINYVTSVFLTEINSVTDNPTVFPEDDEVISGGNFHGQPLAIALDFLCIALAELGSISERRTYKLISGQRGLPHFLAADAGLNSGFMIPQYTAASIVSQNKQLCTPASVDTIDSSNGQEDHVSMGANAATKCYRVVENVKKLLAIEMMNAAQALEFRKPLRSSHKVESFVAQFRKYVDFNLQDKVMYTEMQAALRFINEVN
ncbi:MAG: histidine ammonia-lyase [Bacteroidia bacterium]